MARLGLLAWGLVAVFLALQLTMSALRGGFFDIMQIALMLAPFIFLILINVRRIWHVVILMLIPIHIMTLPYYGLRALSFALIFLSFVSLIVLLDKLIHAKARDLPMDAAAILMLGVAVIYTLRFLHDRPGIVGFGMQRGGFSSALYGLVSGWFFLSTRAIFAHATLTRRQLALIGIFTLLCNVYMAYWSVQWGLFRWFQELADAPTWMSASAVLSLLAPNLQGGGGALFYLGAVFYMSLAAVSAHRSRIFFILGIIMTISMYVKRWKRTALMVGIVAMLGIAGALVIGGGQLPESMARALSLALPERYWKNVRATGPMGWEDAFRTEMFRLAWELIKMHPITGNGLGFELQRALQILAVGGSRVHFDMLALGKSFHNTYLIVATDVGLPAVLAYIAATLIILIPFVRRTAELPMNTQKMWHMTLISFWLANFGMAMINGGQYELFNGCVVLGAMAGLLNRKPATVSVPVAAPTISALAQPDIAPLRSSHWSGRHVAGNA